MGENSKIEWCNHTWNPWIGCQEVSPACDNCYARVLAERWGWAKWGPKEPRRQTSEENRLKPIAWDRSAEKAGERRRVFCLSLGDWLDNAVPQAWRTEIAVMIDRTPNLDWLLLTKRPENFAKLTPWRKDHVPENVWIGFTAEDQEHYDRRWRAVRQIPARIRFCSYEPALGPIEIDEHSSPSWFIFGGETGEGRRDCEIKWAQDLYWQTRETGSAFFIKQDGGRKPGTQGRIPDDLWRVKELPTP